MTLFEVDEAANRIREEVDPDANIIFGSTFDDQLDGKIRVSVVATGIDVAASAAKPVPATAKTGGVVRSLSEARQSQAKSREGFAAERRPRRGWLRGERLCRRGIRSGVRTASLGRPR